MTEKSMGLTLKGLLDWLEAFASEEGRALVGGAGRDGFDEVATQADELAWLVASVLLDCAGKPCTSDERQSIDDCAVRRMLAQLALALRSLAELAI